MDQAKPPGIEIAQIIVERAFFSHREDYLRGPPILDQPELPLELQLQFKASPDSQRGIVALEVRTDNTKNPRYRLDIRVVGLIRVVKGSENMPLEQFAALNGGAFMFPFVRELVANLTARGRFGPVWIHPVNLVAKVNRSGGKSVSGVAEPGSTYGGKAKVRSAKKR